MPPPTTASLTARIAAVPAAVRRLAPGIALCGAVALAALLLKRAEAALFGQAWLGTLVLAILLGTVVRTAWRPAARFRAGIAFSGRTLLEVAVMLLGASVSAQTLLGVGGWLLLGIVGVVTVSLGASILICRLLGLPLRLAILVACGNSICGNSAIAAVAPVIGADSDDVAASIAFTAVLGVIVVLALPVLLPLLSLSVMEYGALAGLTVYAVPQVLAATATAGPLAVQVGTVVKLVRVLMLGPVVVALSLFARSLRDAPASPSSATITAGPRPRPGRPPLHRLVPWFIVGFLGLAALRSLELIPPVLLPPTAGVTESLTILAMAALGLGVDVRTVARAGPRVVAATSLSLVVLGGIALAVIVAVGVG